MATLLFDVMNIPAGNGGGTAKAVGGLERKAFTLEGTWTATSYQLQISLLQNADGSPPGAADPSWINEGSALTSAGAVEVTKPCAWARWFASGFTSAASASRVAGLRRQ